MDEIKVEGEPLPRFRLFISNAKHEAIGASVCESDNLDDLRMFRRRTDRRYVDKFGPIKNRRCRRIRQASQQGHSEWRQRLVLQEYEMRKIDRCGGNQVIRRRDAAAHNLPALQ